MNRSKYLFKISIVVVMAIFLGLMYGLWRLLEIDRLSDPCVYGRQVGIQSTYNNNLYVCMQIKTANGTRYEWIHMYPTLPPN